MADQQPAPAMTDRFGRRIDYVRLSVTDRCDLRCRYCMSDSMVFLPRADLLTLEELAQIGRAMVARGVRRIRLTGGEPLVRRGVMGLIRDLGALVGDGLDELTLTTNATQLAPMAPDIAAAGVRRINVSLDSLDPDRFGHITRRGDIGPVLAGIDAALAAGIAVKINMVVLKGINDGEVPAMLRWCGVRGMDLSLIETMPLGFIDDDRAERFVSLDDVRRDLSRDFTLVPSVHRTGGPSRYYEVAETGRRIGFITPLSENFCAGCNRIRITATGTIYGCLGHDQNVELRDAFRAGGRAAVDAALDAVIAGKPQRHDFDIHRTEPAVARHMSATGG